VEIYRLIKAPYTCIESYPDMEDAYDCYCPTSIRRRPGYKNDLIQPFVKDKDVYHT